MLRIVTLQNQKCLLKVRLKAGQIGKIRAVFPVAVLLRGCRPGHKS